jgi:hypothetical protein
VVQPADDRARDGTRGYAVRSTIGGANALAPTAVVGELNLPVCVPTRDGKGVYVQLQGVLLLVADDTPHDVLDTQEMFARHGWRFRFEDDYTVHLPGDAAVQILPCSSGLPVTRVLPVKAEEVAMAQAHITVARGAHDVLLQAARIGAPTAAQLRQFVRRAPGACISVEKGDATAARLLSYCSLHKRAMMKNVPYGDKEVLAQQPGDLTFADYFGPFCFLAIGTKGVHGLLGLVDEHSDHVVAAMANSVGRRIG